MRKFLVILFISAAFFAVIYWQMFSAPSSSAQTSLFIISSGQPLAKIADNLKAQNFIRSKTAFLLFAKAKSLDRTVRPGRYQLNKNLNIQQIIAHLTDPNQREVSVLVPEGFATEEIDQRLVELSLGLPAEFFAKALPLEGYLFPDTYFVDSNFNPDDLIQKMQDNFKKKVGADLLRAIQGQEKTLADVIIMASIIEKEVRTDPDYPVVSGILWKRLAHGWPLQADSTLLYGKTVRTLSASDLTEKSPYNTRINKGLPPTPICNPGMKAIRAAVFPNDSPYWFYLTDKEGAVHYAATNEEHNENRRRYLE